MEEKNNVQTEMQTLLQRMTELLSAPQTEPQPEQAVENLVETVDNSVEVPQNQEPAPAQPFPSLEEIKAVVNKAVEFRPMEPQKEQSEVEKFLFRQGGPLSRYTTI